jgi:uncharacterized membrane protein
MAMVSVFCILCIKSLSPASNDPTTAVQAMDQIEDPLIRLGQSLL